MTTRFENDELAQITNGPFVPDKIVTLAADKKSPETFYLIKIINEYDTKDYEGTDDYSHRMKNGQKH